MSLDRSSAVIAAIAVGTTSGQQIDEEGLVELKNGWFVPWIPSDKIGSSGVVIAKADGTPFVLGSAFSIERDLRFYEKGYAGETYDLVVLEIRSHHGTVEFLVKLGAGVVEPQYETGTVWRITRPLSKREIEERLRSLPCVFTDMNLYFKLEILEEVESEEAFAFTALPRPRLR